MAANRNSALARIPREGLRAIAYTPAKTAERDWGQMMKGAKKDPTASSEQDVATAIGDSWWALYSRPRGMLFTFTIEQPQGAN